MLGPMPSDNEVRPGALGRDYGDVLWQREPGEMERARISGYRRWLASDRGGKKLEVPVRKILLGTPVSEAADPDALADPEVLTWFAR